MDTFKGHTDQRERRGGRVHLGKHCEFFWVRSYGGFVGSTATNLDLGTSAENMIHYK